VTSQADTVLDLFRTTGAYLRGHFRLTSGLHSPEYLQCALVLQHPEYACELGQALAEELRAEALRAEALRKAAPGKIDLVAAPALGGLIIGHEVARALGARFIFTERDDTGKMTLRRGFTVTPGEAAVIVEDVVTTGGSTREVVELLHGLGAINVAAGSIIDRSGGAAYVGMPRTALATLTADAWPPEFCPLCAEGRPVEKPGSRPA